MAFHPPTLVVEHVTNDSELRLLTQRLVPIPDTVDAYELPETMCMFPPDTPIAVKAIFHMNTREIILHVSCAGRLLLGLIAVAHGIFEASSSVKADTDLRITLVQEAHAA